MLTGITALEVRLFRPEDSQAVAEALVGMLRALVASLSERARAETLAYVDAEFEAADRRLAEALDAIERFRRRTRTVSPTEEAALNSATIARLTEQLTELRVRLRTLVDTVPNSPQIPRLAERIESLEAQIATTRATVGGAAESALPEHLTAFERLRNEYQVALDAYVATLGLRQQARASATLGRAHLVVFVPPREAVTATAPERAREVATVAAVAFALWVIGRVLLASLRTP
jgi:capsular polysaccharide transport system permease protein